MMLHLFLSFSYSFKCPSKESLLEGPGADFASAERFGLILNFQEIQKTNRWSNTSNQNLDFELPSDPSEMILRPIREQKQPKILPNWISNDF